MKNSRAHTRRRALLGALVLGCVLASGFGMVAVVPGEDACETTSTDSSTTDSSSQSLRQFVPSQHWQEVTNDHAVPPGLDIRFDLEAGKKFAKLPDGVASLDELPTSTGPTMNAPNVDEAEKIPVVEPSIVWGTDLDVQEDDDPPVPDVSNLTDSLKQLLLDLPEPEPELVDGIRNKLSEEQMEEIYRRVWRKRQQEIRDAFKATRDDITLIKSLLGTLVRGRPDQRETTIAAGLEVSSIDDQIQALIDLEYIVSDIDQAGDFFHLGGLQVIGDALSFGDADAAGDDQVVDKETLSQYYDVRAKSAWVLGTAVKNQFKLQAAIADSMVVKDVLDLVVSAQEQGFVRAASKGLYCLGSILRHNPPAQEQFVALNGPQQLQAVSLRAIMTSEPDGCDATKATTEALLSKITALVIDLAENASEDTRSTHSALVETLQHQAPTWLTVAVHTLQCAQNNDATDKGLAAVDALAGFLAQSAAADAIREGVDAAAANELAAEKLAPTFAAAAAVVAQTVASLSEQCESVDDIDDVEFATELLEIAQQVLRKLSP